MADEFELLRVHYFTFQCGNKKHRVSDRSGVMTAMGDIERGEWEKRARALVEKYGEHEQYGRLLNEFCLLACRTLPEREFYALQLHMSRIWENPAWVRYNEWHGIIAEPSDTQQISIFEM